MPTVKFQDLVDFSRAVFVAAGTPPGTAQIVAASLVKSNLLGHDSHGVRLIPPYVERIQQGFINLEAEPAIERQAKAVTIVDGDWGFGQIVAPFGAKLAGELARSFGMGCVALSRSNHIGRLGEYTQLLADDGLIGMVMTGISNSKGRAAPFGGRDRIFGTNPMAWGVPVDDARPPLILDFATSAVAVGKVAVASAEGTMLPQGALLDQDGQPSIDPASFFAGGVLQPFGMHKGSGLLLMVELLTIGLAGLADGLAGDNRLGNPTLMMAWSIAAFQSPAQFQQHVEAVLQRVQASRPASGFEEVLLPGEPEARMKAQRLQEGIPIPDPTWRELTDLAQTLGLSPDQVIGS